MRTPLHPMLPFLPQDIFVHIIDALDAQYTPGTGQRSDIWHPGRVSTLRSMTLASRTLCALARPRLFAHIDFDAGRGAQARAARLLRYLVHEEHNERDGADLRPDEISECRLQSIRSFRLRDGGGPYKIRIPQTHWRPDLGTPLGRLLALFLDAPQLQMFAFEGDMWTLAGASELVGYQDYIYTMSCKPSLRVLALSNAYDVPIDVFFTERNWRHSETGIRSLHITNVSFVSRESAQDLRRGGSAALAVLHPIEHLKLGRLNYTHTFDMLQMRRTAMDTSLLSSRLSNDGPLFYRLKSLCVALSVVPAQMTALWNLVYGLRGSLEDLQIQHYESIADKSRSSTLQQAEIKSLGFRQTLEEFASLDTLTLSTHILGSSTRWMDSTGNLRWGLPLLVDFLGTFMGCPIPGLRQLKLEIFFMGEDVSRQAQADETAQNISLEQTAVDPVWRTLDSLLTSPVCASPAVTISIILLPFFLIKHGSFANAEGSSGSKFCISKAIGDAFGMDECLPNLFAKAQVDVQVDAVLSDKDMLTCLRSA